MSLGCNTNLSAARMAVGSAVVGMNRVSMFHQPRQFASQLTSRWVALLCIAAAPAVLGQEPERPPSEDASPAAALFQEHCAKCHGKDGHGAGQPQRNLVDRKWHHGAEVTEIEATIGAGVAETEMPAWRDQLSPEAVTLLAHYLLALEAKKHGTTTTPRGPQATRLTNLASANLSTATLPLPPDRNLIDEYIFGRLRKENIPHAGLCSDTDFFRRIHLDLTGRLPDAAEVRTFLADQDATKRDKLIDQLLGIQYSAVPVPADYQAPWQVGEPFVSKWRYFFEDLFRNYDECSLDTSAFRNYLVGFLKSNIPYDVLVRDMLSATAVNSTSSGAAGFLVRQAAFVITHEDKCDQNNVYITRNFLGINLHCISCHDGSDHLDQINLWLSQKKRVEFWRQSAFLGDVHILRPGGQPYYVLVEGRRKDPRPDAPNQLGMAGFEFGPFTDPAQTDYRLDLLTYLRTPRDPEADVFPAFILDGAKPRDGLNPRHEFARMVTESQQFAKVAVNLIWAQFMTVGIVDPPLDWDLARQDPDHPPPAPWELQPSHPHLLDALADDFRKQHFNLRHLMRTICRSNAYQLSSQTPAGYEDRFDRLYSRKLVRRLWAQEIVDAILKSTTVSVTEKDFAMNSKGPTRDVLVGHDIDLSRFLDTFGQSNRDTKEADTQSISLLQSATMLNSTMIKSKVLASTAGSRVAQLLTDYPPATWWEEDGRVAHQILEELFLTTLSRLPTPGEVNVLLEHMRQHRQVGLEDVHWSLLNQLEFILNR